MKITPFTLLALLIAMLIAAASHASINDERAELKERFKQRYPALLQLMNQGKVGETHDGKVEAVRAEFNDGQAGGTTVRQLLAAENRDRDRLYTLIAEETGATVPIVAERAARKNFQNASPDHYLKFADGWRQKKDGR